MKNTTKQGKLRFLIYGSKNKYIGICYELGMVEQGQTINEVQHRLTNGAKAIIETCIKEKLSNKILNQKPPLKYLFEFHFILFLMSLSNFISQIRNVCSFRFFDENISELSPSF